MLDSVVRGRDLSRRIAALGRGLTPQIEVDRANTLLANLEQQALSFRRDWRSRSADLTRVLRLDPAAVVVPLEPPHLRVTLVSPQLPLDNLIPIGLTNRPELMSNQAVVQATLVRLRQERMRPLIPSLVLSSNATPNGLLGGGVFGTGTSGLTNWSGRSDWDAAVVWQLKNLGFGNRGLITQPRRAMAGVGGAVSHPGPGGLRGDASAGRRRSCHGANGRAEAELKFALLSYAGNLKGLSETVRAGDLLVLVNRPQEVVAALQQLQQAYIDYYTTSNDYNRAQFRLFRAGLPGPEPRLWRGPRTDSAGRSVPSPHRWLPSAPQSRARTARVDVPSSQIALNGGLPLRDNDASQLPDDRTQWTVSHEIS